MNNVLKLKKSQGAKLSEVRSLIKSYGNFSYSLKGWESVRIELSNSHNPTNKLIIETKDKIVSYTNQNGTFGFPQIIGG